MNIVASPMCHYKKKSTLSTGPLLINISWLYLHLAYNGGRFFIHDKKDFPSITTQTGSIAFSITGGRHYLIRKTKLSSVSTSNEKCIEHDINVCKDIELNHILKDHYQCQIPLLYSGYHLPKSDSLRICNSTITYDTLENMTKNNYKLPCNFTLRVFKIWVKIIWRRLEWRRSADNCRWKFGGS